MDVMEMKSNRAPTQNLADSLDPSPTELAHTPIKWHKLFSDQGRECKKAGNRFVVEVPEALGLKLSVPSQAVNVCVPFKTYCRSTACVHMRKPTWRGAT